MATNFEDITEAIRIKNKWEGSGLLDNLDYKDQLLLSSLLEEGSDLLKAVNTQDDVPKHSEQIAGLFLPAIARKFKKTKTVNVNQLYNFLLSIHDKFIKIDKMIFDVNVELNAVFPNEKYATSIIDLENYWIERI